MGTKTTAKTTKKKQQSGGFWDRHRKLCGWLAIISGCVIFIALAIYIAFQVSPWPSALLIRKGFDDNDKKVAQALEKYLPAGITEIENQPYRQNDSDALLDVMYPEHAIAQLPTVVWVHGGAWVAGGKDDIDNYLKILAARGFAVVSVNYTLAPEKQYPTPILQLNDALDYLQQNAKRLHIDPERIILAGDSAGSQIVAQMANIITSPSYANLINIQPKLSASKLKGVLLNCGAYDLALPDYNGTFGGFLHTVLWAYSGTKDFLHDPKLNTASVANYLTPQFPPAFITAGNVDPLLQQSTELAKRLEGVGVQISTLFYPADHKPELNHEYQFDLDQSDGKKALEQMVEFLQNHAK
jgi:acetyl esterase